MDLDRQHICLADGEAVGAQGLLGRFNLVDNQAQYSKVCGICHRKCPNIDIIFSDIIMPEMDGPEAFEGLMNMDPAVKILLLSGWSKDEKVERLINDGAVGFVQKPFDLKIIDLEE